MFTFPQSRDFAMTLSPPTNAVLVFFHSANTPKRLRRDQSTRVLQTGRAALPRRPKFASVQRHERIRIDRIASQHSSTLRGFPFFMVDLYRQRLENNSV
jgi:hypothetical protein